MKKFLASALSAAMLLSLLAGCGGTPAQSGNGSNPANPGTTSNPAPAGDNVIKIGVFEPSSGGSASSVFSKY